MEKGKKKRRRSIIGEKKGQLPMQLWPDDHWGGRGRGGGRKTGLRQIRGKKKALPE